MLNVHSSAQHGATHTVVLHPAEIGPSHLSCPSLDDSPRQAQRLVLLETVDLTVTLEDKGRK